MPKIMPAFPIRLGDKAGGIILAAILQAGFVFALVAGLDITPTKIFGDSFEVTLPKTVVDHPPPPAPPTNREPDKVVAVNPTVVLETPRGDTAPTVINPEATQAPAGPNDHGPVSVAATHTTPPYPALEARLGSEGTVFLKLTIGADGKVLAAELVKSSGVEGLDRAAAAWVMAHWRYQPASKGGHAVESAANVAVTFHLANRAL